MVDEDRSPGTILNVMMGALMKTPRSVGLLVGVGGLTTAYVLTVRGALTLDLNLGRRTRSLGPIELDVQAEPETVFDVIAQPYLGKTPRAMEKKLEVLERGTDMVIAAHFTPVAGGLTATTVESVRFERPHVVAFSLLRGPVPYVRETFTLGAIEAGTRFTYAGELGADLWALGRWWGSMVAGPWERTVEASMQSIKVEAERIAQVQRH